MILCKKQQDLTSSSSLNIGRSCLARIKFSLLQIFEQSMKLLNRVTLKTFQYTINSIPPVEVHPSSNCSELTVVMTDDSKYIISPQDLHNIIYMTPGAYPVQDVTGGKRCYDLIIQEILLNRDLIQAIKMTNEIVHTVNQWVANPKRGGNVVSKLVRKKSDAQVFFNDVRSNGRLVEVFAVLKQATLAVTHKLGGRKVSRMDAIQTMARDMRHLRAIIGHTHRAA